MFGSGLIELAAREMTQDLHAIRRKTVEEAARTGHRAELPLVTTGVSFGRIGADPNGTVLTEAIEGIDKDLVVRPWSQKGVVTSLRTFTVTALNHHHGMQATERFGIRLTGSRDFDRDGVEDEIREGEVTALTLFQATLPAPGPVPTTSERSRGVLALGRALFERVECTGCHLPALPLRSTVYVEPGPFNLEGTLRQSEATSVVEVDVAASEWGVRLPRDAQGRVLVEAFTDLKRHKIADPETPRLANEIVSQGFSSTDEFLTKRLWEVGSSLGSYGHRGDITTIREVILAHGGEARTSRLKFVALDATEQASVIEFLKSMRTPSVPAPQDPPNVISQSMWSALVEVGALPDSNAGADLLASATYDRILTRAIAAADRAEHTLARLRSLSARIDHERSKAGQAALQVASHSLVSDPPSRISGVLGDLLSSSGLDQRPQIPGLVEQVMRAENATLQAIDTAGHALAAATFAGADPIPITPIGYIPAASVFRSLEDATSNGDVEKVLVELAAWCEDLAFRVEQLGQQVSTAALRAEAFARASQTRGKPPELATR